MERREGYKGLVIEARIHELKDGGFSAEFTIEDHDGSGVTETQFFVPNPFLTEESALDASVQAARRKTDLGFASSPSKASEPLSSF